MSLAIDIDKVTAVLVGGVWYEVARESFFIDSYEFVDMEAYESGAGPLLGGGDESLISARGASWEGPDKVVMVCPLSSIMAVRVY